MFDPGSLEAWSHLCLHRAFGSMYFEYISYTPGSTNIASKGMEKSFRPPQIWMCDFFSGNIWGRCFFPWRAMLVDPGVFFEMWIFHCHGTLLQGTMSVYVLKCDFLLIQKTKNKL